MNFIQPVLEAIKSTQKIFDEACNEEIELAKMDARDIKDEEDNQRDCDAEYPLSGSCEPIDIENEDRLTVERSLGRMKDEKIC